MKTKTNDKQSTRFLYAFLAIFSLFAPTLNAQVGGSGLPAPPPEDPKLQVWNYSTMDLILYKRASHGADWKYVARVPQHSFSHGAGDGKQIYNAKQSEEWSFGAEINGSRVIVAQMDFSSKAPYTLSAFVNVEKPRINIYNYSQKTLSLYRKPPGGGWQLVKLFPKHTFSGNGNGKELFDTVVGESWGFAIQQGAIPVIRKQVDAKIGWNELAAFVDIDSTRVTVWNDSNNTLLLYKKPKSTNQWEFFTKVAPQAPGSSSNKKESYVAEFGETWCLARQQGTNLTIIKEVTISENGLNQLSSN